LANRLKTKQNAAPRSKNAPPGGGSSGNESDLTRREAADYIAGCLTGWN